MTQQKIYIDYASTTPVSDKVMAAMLPYFQQNFYNPSAMYMSAKHVHDAIEQARSSIAAEMQVRPVELLFTAGSTEANNLVIHGVMRQYPAAKVVCSAIEHAAVLRAAQQYKHALLAVGADGVTDVSQLNKVIDDETVLVCCMTANNETGVLQPLDDIKKIIAAIKSDRTKRGITLPLYVHTDASQSFLYERLLPHELQVDFAVISGSKMYGPKQAAVLFVKQGIQLAPLLFGGSQEYGTRPGTENVPAIIGLAAAVQEVATTRLVEAERLRQLQQYCIEQLTNQFGAVINGSLKYRLPNNVHATFNGIDNEILVMQLDERGIMTAVGSACHAANDEPSYVLQAMGLSIEQARSSIRFTFGRSTNEKSIMQLVQTLAECLQL